MRSQANRQGLHLPKAHSPPAAAPTALANARSRPRFNWPHLPHLELGSREMLLAEWGNKCDVGWCQVEDWCFNSFDELVDFRTAASNCAAHQANLASINSDAEDEIAYQLVALPSLASPGRKEKRRRSGRLVEWGGLHADVAGPVAAAVGGGRVGLVGREPARVHQLGPRPARPLQPVRCRELRRDLWPSRHENLWP